MELEGDSSLHFVSLRMTDTCVLEEGPHCSGGDSNSHGHVSGRCSG
jgi:hypothetical protein